MGAVGLAVFVQTFEITGSPAALGLLGPCSSVAMLLGVLGGSAVVDHADRRPARPHAGRLLHLRLGAAGWQPPRRPPLALIYLSSALGSALASLHFPTCSAMIPRSSIATS
jgi:hypothetical protein